MLLLLADAPLTAMVGDRINPVKFSQGGAWPSIEYNLIAGQAVDNLEGGSDTRRYRMSFDVRAVRYWEVVAVAGALETALRGSRPTFASEIVSISDFPYETGAEVYRRTVDAAVWGTA